jgi:hypothetical protein
MIRSSQLLIALLSTLTLFAAGHDVSAVRYAANDSFAAGPSIAFSGSRFLTIWTMPPHIYGALSDPSSDTMPPAFPAVPFANPSNTLRLTAAGSGYLAIWNQQGSTPPALGTFTSEGVLDHRVQLDVSTLIGPQLAFNGSHILVFDLHPVFLGVSKTNDVSLYDLSGALVRRSPLPYSVGDTYAVTAVGNDFAVVTAGRSGINEWRVTNDGTIVSTLQIEPPPANPLLPVYNIAVASKDGRIAIAWWQLQVGTVSSAVIEGDGSVTRLSLPNGGVPPVSGLAILPAGTGFVVVWNVRPSPPDNPGIFALRLSVDGSLLDARPVSLGAGTFSAAASSANAIAVTLTLPPSAATTVIATVDANGISPRAATPTGVTPVRQLLPAVTGNGSGFTAAWLEQSAGFRGIVAGRVSYDGEPLDGSGTTLGLNYFSAPTIAHSSSEALVVWATIDSIVAARLSPSGNVLDATPILISKQSPGSLAVAWNGSRYFVVWTNGLQLFGAFVEPDGAVTSTKALSGNPIAPTILSAPDVAWDGRQFIVVFGEVTYEVICSACAPPPADHVRIMRVSATGDAIDTAPVRVPGLHTRAHVASSGAESLIALDNGTDTSTVVVHSEDGALHLDAEVPLFHWFHNVASDVAWNGSTYVVGWQYAPSLSLSATGRLGAARVSRAGIPLDSFFTPAAGQPDIITQSAVPSVAANDAGDVAFVISEMAPPSYASRARLYLMSEMAPMPPAPPAPRNVISSFSGSTTLIEWQSEAGADGFLIERSIDFGKTWLPTLVTGDVRSTITNAGVGNQYRVSAFGPGGLSAGTVTSVGSPQRHRASH